MGGGKRIAHGRQEFETRGSNKIAMMYARNQTWQWKMDHLSVTFLLKPPFSLGIFQPAMFDYQRVCFTVCKSLRKVTCCIVAHKMELRTVRIRDRIRDRIRGRIPIAVVGPHHQEVCSLFFVSCRMVLSENGP